MSLCDKLNEVIKDPSLTKKEKISKQELLINTHIKIYESFFNSLERTGNHISKEPSFTSKGVRYVSGGIPTLPSLGENKAREYIVDKSSELLQVGSLKS